MGFRVEGSEFRVQDNCLVSDDVVWVLDPESRLEKGLLLLSRSLHPRAPLLQLVCASCGDEL